ncbi:hypothetical protein HDU93_001112 [Gonapodya sp. JEL0774]|nr:hypothetical protein HDU93_001112 [Gonapodya sp. JEL0774]
MEQSASIAQESPISISDIPVLKEEKLFKRFVTVYNRTIRQPSGLVSEWDIVGHDQDGKGVPCAEANFVAVFPFDTKTKTTTLVREYAQGPHQMLYTVPCGAYDVRKHSSHLDAAQHELSEEALLTGGTWITLSSGRGIPELKWSTNLFHVFLCLDPVEDSNPGQRDPEEIITVCRNVAVDDLKASIMRGEMLLPAVQTSWMALEYLEKNSLLK